MLDSQFEHVQLSFPNFGFSKYCSRQSAQTAVQLSSAQPSLAMSWSRMAHGTWLLQLESLCHVRLRRWPRKTSPMWGSQSHRFPELSQITGAQRTDSNSLVGR